MQNINSALKAKLDLLEWYSDDLARMKAQNKSTADMLAWLRRQGVNQIHGGHLAAFWKHRAEASKDITIPPSQPSEEGEPMPSRGSVPGQGLPPDEVKPPGNCVASSASDPDLDFIMGQYRKLLSKLLDQALADPSPENVKQVNLMMSKVMNYDLGLVRSNHRERTLKLREQSKNQTLTPHSHKPARQPAVSTAEREILAPTESLPLVKSSHSANTSASRNQGEMARPIAPVNPLPNQPPSFAPADRVVTISQIIAGGDVASHKLDPKPLVPA